MPASSVTGSIWGDEGKGKVVDVIGEESDLVIRWNGGNNAGHTVKVGDEKYVAHMCPVGVIQRKKSGLGAGVVIDPRQLIEELEEFEKFDPDLMIDPRAHIVMPYHNLLDGARETLRSKKIGVEIGTTRKGMGPVHEDRSNRLGIRFFDLVDPKRLEDKLNVVYPEKEFMLKEFYGVKDIPSKKEIFDQYRELGERLKPYLGDVSKLVLDNLKENKNVLFEGANGTLLDIMYGNYPRVTSSHPLSTSIYTNVGIPDSVPIHHIGVLKAYMTKVGSGPVVTGLDGGNWPVNEKESEAEAIKIRDVGDEYGATTGRPRRVGWLDLVAANYSCVLNGFDELAITKLDVLAGMDPLKIATAYVDSDRNVTQEYKGWDLDYLNNCEPVYMHTPGFNNMIKSDGSIDENAQRYIDLVAKATGIPVNFISTGAGRDEYILKGKNWWNK